VTATVPDRPRTARWVDAARVATTLAFLLLVTSCGTEDTGGTSPAGPAGSPAPGRSEHPVPPPSTGDRDTAVTTVELASGSTTVRGTLENTPAGRDFSALLPLTLAVSDFHATEKISDLPRRLSTDGAPAGTEPAAGDISYYAPWGNLALFYRDYPYSDGLVRLGRLDPGAAELLEGLAEGATITISPTN
jgi:hypothetical protein